MLTTVASVKPKTTYMDYAATTPLDAEVLAVMLPYFDASYANPSSMHASGRRAKQAITRARMSIAELLNSLFQQLSIRRLWSLRQHSSATVLKWIFCR